MSVHRAEAPPFQFDDTNPVAAKIENDAMMLRLLRNQVRYTAGLVSTLFPVREELSDKWACDFVNRVVYWRPTLPFPPFRPLAPTEVLFLICHEAGHLNYTGGWVLPEDWSRMKKRAFNMFLNGVEDIRIERLMAREFPGFAEIRPRVNRTFILHHMHRESEEYPIWIQAVYNWIAIENMGEQNGARIGHPEVIRFCLELWKEISLMANSPTTNRLAQALIPIFERIWEEQEKENESRKPGETGHGSGMGGVAGEFEGAGKGFPEQPSEETWDEFPELKDTMTPAEQMEELARSSTGKASEGVRIDLQEAGKAEASARVAARKLETSNRERTEGNGIGDTPGAKHPAGTYWTQTKNAHIREINALAHRLKAVLVTNEAGSWTEGTRRGRLNSRRAKRAVAGNNRIFRKRTEIGSHDYTFGIVVDTSGSMASKVVLGKKACYWALEGLVVIAEALDRAGMKTFVVTHDTDLKSGKQVTQRLADEAEQLGADVWHSTGGTYEAPALIVAEEEFLRSTGHKVLFVISDGKTRSPDHSRSLVQELEKKGVMTIAIGIAIDPPQHHPVRVRISGAPDLQTVLPRLINAIVRKGR